MGLFWARKHIANRRQHGFDGDVIGPSVGDRRIAFDPRTLSRRPIA